MANTIYNAARGADFFTTGGAGTASGEFTSAKVLGGAAMKIASNSKLDGVSLGRATANPTTNNISYRGLANGVGTAFKGTELSNIIQECSSGGYCSYSGTTLASRLIINALSVGTWLNVNPSSVAVLPRAFKNMMFSAQQITALNSTTGVFVTNLPYSVNYSGTYVVMNANSRNFNTQAKGQYIIHKLANSIAGTYDAKLLGAGNAGTLTRSIQKVETTRTTKTLTALRAGYFNKYTGKWTTAPGIAEDYTATYWTGGAIGDDAATPSRTAPGGITIKYGAAKPSYSTGYAARTTW
jgi:hypothetical protein